MALQTIVIVGAGQAGGWAAKTLRDKGFQGRIVLVGEEGHPPHERPPLSKSVLSGADSGAITHLFTPETLAALHLDLRLGTKVVNIDRIAHLVNTAEGEEITYDKLILCTGGRARPLGVEGGDLPGVYTLRTIDDSLAIRDVFKKASAVAVIGGGWIGLEVAVAAREAGARTFIVEAASRLCARTVPPELSYYLLELHRSKGAEVILGAGLTAVRMAGGRLQCVLNSGEPIAADAVVAGIGLIPNDDVARNAGLECAGGILVDTNCRSSDPDIYAAGDVAVITNPWAGGRIRLESWQNAQSQGIAAASAALGQEVNYEPLPWFWSDQYGNNIQIYGLPKPEHRVVFRPGPAAGSHLFFYMAEDTVVAAVGVNAGRLLPVVRRLVMQGSRVSDSVLSDPASPLPRG